MLYYGWPLPLTLDRRPAAGRVFILSLLALTAYALWRFPRLGFLGAWFFLTLAPTSSVMPIATEVGAERRMYLAAHPARRAGRDGFRRLVSVAAAARRRVRGRRPGARHRDRAEDRRLSVESSTRRNHGRTVADAGGAFHAGNRTGRGGTAVAEAERHLREAAPVHPPARYYLGTVLAAQGRRGEAIEHYQSFIASQRTDLDQVHIARALLAEALVEEGRPEEAAAQYRAMLANHPDDGQAMSLLAAIPDQQGHYEEAIALFRKGGGRASQRRRPTLIGLGIALASSGRLDEAIAIFRRRSISIPGTHTRKQPRACAGATPLDPCQPELD